MTSIQITLSGLGGMVLLTVATWLLSLRLRDVSIVDSVWSLFFLAGALTYAALAPTHGARATIVLALVAVWALRLSGAASIHSNASQNDLAAWLIAVGANAV